MQALSVSVANDAAAALKRFSCLKRISIDQAAQSILENYVMEALEDAEDAADADRILYEAEANGEEAVPAEQVYKELGL